MRSLVDHADPGLSLSELHVRTGFLGEGGGDGWSLEFGLPSLKLTAKGPENRPFQLEIPSSNH